MQRHPWAAPLLFVLVLAAGCDGADGFDARDVSAPPPDVRDVAAGPDTPLPAPDAGALPDAVDAPDAAPETHAADVAAVDAPAEVADAGPAWPPPRPLPAPPSDPEPAWVLLDDDLAAVERTLDAAVAHGVETVQLSHGLIMAPEDVLADAGRLARLSAAAAAAKARGLGVLLWSHELEGDVTYQVCFDPADPLWDARRQAYRDLLDAVPDADGIVLMFGSAKVEPWLAVCVCGWCLDRTPAGQPPAPLETPPPDERVEFLLRLVADVVVGERGRRLLFRSFVHQPRELVAIGAALDRMADVAVQPMSKDVPQDWQLHYPTDPLFGRYPDRGHVMELDAAGEYWGQSALPFAGVGYVHRRMLDALAGGATGFAARVERGSRSALGTANEVNLYVAERLLADPAVPPDTLWAEWVAARYGLPAGGPDSAALVRILARTEAIARRTFYDLGFWALVKGSEPPRECRSAALLTARSNAKWDDAPGWAELEAALLAPTPAVLASLAQEKYEAAALAAANVAELEAVAPALAAGDAAALRHQVALQAAAVAAWDAVTQVVWTFRLWRASASAEHAAWLEAALQRLEAQAAAVRERFGGADWPVRADNLAACAADVRGAFRVETAPAARAQPFLEPPALVPCGVDLCVTLTASEPVRLALRFGWRLPYPEVRLEGPPEPVTSHTFRVPPLPAGRWAVLRPEAAWAEGTLLGGDVWVWPATAAPPPTGWRPAASPPGSTS
jgi:hypothetical protein